MVKLSSFLFTALLVLVLAATYLAILGRALARASRRRRRARAMWAARMVRAYPGAVGTGGDEDPYLEPWERAMERWQMANGRRGEDG